MRKLTVKNFSVIKEAELEFGKITVLIGPQSSGKSLLCKLAYFLGREAITIAINRVAKGFEYADFESAVMQEFVRWFPRGGWGNEPWTITLSSHEFEVEVSMASDSEPVLRFSEVFKVAYDARLRVTFEEQRKRGILIAQALESLAATVFMKLAGRGVWDTSIYIPTERSYFVDTTKGYRVLGTEAEPVSAHFAEVFSNSMNPESLKSRISKYLKGDLVYLQNLWMIAFHDGRLLPLSYISSGDKQTLPLLAALDYYEYQRRQAGSLVTEVLYGDRLYVYDDFTIEEPESSVFPQTQYDLVKDIAALANEVDFQPHFTVTTHGPYILTAFNTLIEAWRAGNKPGGRGRVASFIPEKFWVSENDFNAYAMHEGVLVSIFMPEAEGVEGSGLIDGDYLDGVSDQLGGEFDRLLDIEYAE
jgi:hypothetical protein